LVLIDGAYKKVTQGVASFDQANEMSDKGAASKARKAAMNNTADAISAYCKIVVEAIAGSAVANDPFNLIYKQGLAYGWMKQMVDASLEEIRKEDPETFSKVDVVMSKAVKDGFIKRWKAKLVNGVNLLVNSKGVQMVCGWVREAWDWTKKTWSDFIAWLNNTFKPAKKEDPIPEPS
jgi:hypothetical protein